MEQICEVKQEFGKWKLDKNAVAVFKVKEGMFSDLKDYSVHDNITTESIEKLKEVQGAQTVRISTDYLKQLMKVVTKNKIESVKLTVAHDFPLIVQSDEMEFIIAPRVQQED